MLMFCMLTKYVKQTDGKRACARDRLNRNFDSSECTHIFAGFLFSIKYTVRHRSTLHFCYEQTLHSQRMTDATNKTVSLRKSYARYTQRLRAIHNCDTNRARILTGMRFKCLVHLTSDYAQTCWAQAHCA